MWLHAIHRAFFPHHCNTLLLQGSMKPFQLLFSFYSLKISQVHQVHWNYPSSITFSQVWRNSSQLARLFKVKVALSPDLNTARWFARLDLSASVQTTRALVGFCSKTWTHDALKVDNTGFFDKTCSFFFKVATFFLKWRLSVVANELFIDRYI